MSTSSTLAPAKSAVDGATFSEYYRSSLSDAYSSGTAITFDGMSITIEDTPYLPASGDVYGVSAASGAAN